MQIARVIRGGVIHVIEHIYLVIHLRLERYKAAIIVAEKSQFAFQRAFVSFDGIDIRRDQAGGFINPIVGHGDDIAVLNEDIHLVRAGEGADDIIYTDFKGFGAGFGIEGRRNAEVNGWCLHSGFICRSVAFILCASGKSQHQNSDNAKILFHDSNLLGDYHSTGSY